MESSTDQLKSYRLFIGNLSSQMTETELMAMIEKFGPVKELRVVKDPVTGSSSGYAFVEMLHEEAASRARRGLNGKQVNGHLLIARPLF